MNKKEKKSNTAKKSNKKMLMLIMIIIIIIAIISGIVIINNKKQEENNNTNNENTFIGDAESEFGLIDMNNTENAKIENGVKENTSESLVKDKSIDGIEMTDIKLFAQEGISDFSATVKNNTGKDFAGGIATVTFINKDGSEYATLEVYVPELKNGSYNTINAATTADITNAYDFTITMQGQ